MPIVVSRRTFQEFDDRYTSRLHGLRDAADYWRQASARQFLHQIMRPTLLLNVWNDRFLAPRGNLVDVSCRVVRA